MIASGWPNPSIVMSFLPRSVASSRSIGSDSIVQTIRSGLAVRPPAVVGISFQDDAPARDALVDVVRPRSRRLVDPLRVDRRPGHDRAEVRHRQACAEVAHGTLQADAEAVAPELLHARDLLRRSPHGCVCADDLPHEGSRRRAHPRVGVAVERVGEALRGHGRAVVEAERPLQLEGVRAAAVRDACRSARPRERRAACRCPGR